MKQRLKARDATGPEEPEEQNEYCNFASTLYRAQDLGTMTVAAGDVVLLAARAKRCGLPCRQKDLMECIAASEIWRVMSG